MTIAPQGRDHHGEQSQWGEHEPLGSVAVAQAMTDLIPDARLEVLPGAHAPWLGDPARAAAVVTDFVTR